MERRKIIGAAVFSAAIAGGGVAGVVLGTPASSSAATGAAGATTSAPGRWLGRGMRRQNPELDAAAKAIGVSTATLESDLKAGKTIAQVAASKGVAEGPARVITTVGELELVEAGEILVCPITAPSWAPVFSRIGGAVSDIGGIMSHAAIVSREYGLPAVVGTGFGTKNIKTGQRIRVDGDNGVVTILE